MAEAAVETTPRQRLLARKNALWSERSSWLSHWQEISDYILPRAGRYFVTDRNRGDKRNRNIYDNTGGGALRILAAGMMAGMTSPARPWFRLGISDRDLMESADVKAWLHRVTLLMRDVFSKSNTYLALHSGYEELGAFGTDADIILPDYDTVIHHYPLTAGEYAIATNHKGKVDTLYREFQMTVGQMVGQFGREACSQTVRNLHDRGALEQWLTVIHAIEPRTDRDPGKKDARNMRFKSCYFEPAKDNYDKYLRESGFEQFPGVVSRWVTTGGDVYGTSPGMDALGDIKQLQHEQLRKSQGIDYQTNPPLQVPSGYKDAARARLPGGIFHIDANSPTGGVRSAFDVRLELQHLLADIVDVRGRIESSFYADLFLMLSRMDRSGITATEVAERHEEKLLMIGPVLERLHGEKLGPMIDLTFDYCAKANILPPPPPELEGMDLNIEFVSTLAQAQRAVAGTGYDRLLGTISSLAPLFPEVVHKIKVNQVVDDYADLYGVNPDIIRSDEEADERANAQAQAAQAAQAAASMPGMAAAAKDVSGLDMGNMRDVMQSVTGYTTPSA
jgi:hypothetical protein